MKILNTETLRKLINAYFSKINLTLILITIEIHVILVKNVIVACIKVYISVIYFFFI